MKSTEPRYFAIFGDLFALICYLMYCIFMKSIFVTLFELCTTSPDSSTLYCGGGNETSIRMCMNSPRQDIHFMNRIIPLADYVFKVHPFFHPHKNIVVLGFVTHFVFVLSFYYISFCIYKMSICEYFISDLQSYVDC